jgi:ATP-dependent DNA ligase
MVLAPKGVGTMSSFKTLIRNMRKMKPDGFIKCQHPNHAIAPERFAIERVIKSGWIAQKKMNGHRLQIHIGPEGQLTAYTRHGRVHTQKLSNELKFSFESYRDKDGWLCLEGEWLKSENQVYLFDILRYKSNTLSFQTYRERLKILKSIFHISGQIKLLRTYKKVDDCLRILEGKDEHIEGLVFKAFDTKGWPDTAIVRCLKGMNRA